MSQFLEFVSALKKFGLEVVSQRYYSTYPGIVSDNEDPEERGRIKIELPTILGDGVVHAQYAEPHLNPIAGLKSGAFFPPYVGDVVDVFFENGDVNHPRYCGGYWEEDELPDDFSENYPDVRGFVFKNGHKLLFDESDGAAKIKLVHADGAVITMDEEGAIQIVDKSGNESIELKDSEINIKSGGKLSITIQGDTEFKVDGDVKIDAGGDANITAGGNAVIKATEIDLNKLIGGQVLTNLTDPVIDLITGAPTMGVPTVKAG